MILGRASDPLACGVFADIAPMLGDGVHAYLKLEAFNAAGSIKLKPAAAMAEALAADGILTPGATLIETSSGNMGVALAIVAKCRGHGFVCVTDEKMTAHNRALIRAYGAELVVMAESTLDDRCDYIRARQARDAGLVWTQQFSSWRNPLAHEAQTAREILQEFARVDYLFVGVGTGGTLAGCARAFAQDSAGTRIVAVDAEGSRHFVEPPAQVRRRIPGIGATRRSPFLDDTAIDRPVIVSEKDTVRACLDLRDATGWLMGGSTGSVVAAALAMRDAFAPGDTVVCVAADMGERYLDAVYDATG